MPQSSGVSRRRSPPSGRPGPTAWRCASSTTTTPSCRPSTPTRPTTSRRSWPSRSTPEPDGKDLIRGIATGYEIQVDLVKAICLHKHKIDHVAHLGPSAAAGIGTLLGTGRGDHLPGRRPGPAHHHRHPPVAQGRDLHLEGARPGVRRQDGRRGSRPRHARRDLPGRRSTKAKTASSPGCSTARMPPTTVPLPAAGEAKRAILDTYTKEHSAEYQAQAWIDLARKLAPRTPARPRTRHERRLDRPSHQPSHALRDRLRRERPAEVRPDGIARDARPLDPVHLHRRPAGRSRGTTSTPTRPSAPAAPDTVALWNKVTTEEDAEWTRRYHSGRPEREGLRRPVVITLHDGSEITDEIAVADAHPLGARPFAREQYIRKFRTWPSRRARRRGDRPLPRRSPQRLPRS